MRGWSGRRQFGGLWRAMTDHRQREHLARMRAAIAEARRRVLAGSTYGESKRLVIEPPCPPCTSHGASIRQPFGAGVVSAKKAARTLSERAKRGSAAAARRLESTDAPGGRTAGGERVPSAALMRDGEPDAQARAELVGATAWWERVVSAGRVLRDGVGRHTERQRERVRDISAAQRQLAQVRVLPAFATASVRGGCNTSSVRIHTFRSVIRRENLGACWSQRHASARQIGRSIDVRQARLDEIREHVAQVRDAPLRPAPPAQLTTPPRPTDNATPAAAERPEGRRLGRSQQAAAARDCAVRRAASIRPSTRHTRTQQGTANPLPAATCLRRDVETEAGGYLRMRREHRAKVLEAIAMQACVDDATQGDEDAKLLARREVHLLRTAQQAFGTALPPEPEPEPQPEPRPLATTQGRRPGATAGPSGRVGELRYAGSSHRGAASAAAARARSPFLQQALDRAIADGVTITAVECVPMPQYNPGLGCALRIGRYQLAARRCLSVARA
jgi:hypothetical protein